MDFCAYIGRTLTIDSNCAALSVLEECRRLQLIEDIGDFCRITRLGGEIGRAQGEPRHEMVAAAKEMLLKKVYLDVDVGDPQYFEIIEKLEPDVAEASLVYRRSTSDRALITTALKYLSMVGLLEASPEQALVRKEHLAFVNQIRLSLRQKKPSEKLTIDEDLNAVGKLAELRAVSDENKRLTSLGFPELGALVQRISEIDTAAGYDIISYSGASKDPTEKIFIEVKGTRNINVSFFWTRNEMNVAKEKRGYYWIYAYTDIDLIKQSATGPVKIRDPLRRLRSLGYKLEPRDVYVFRG